MENELMYVSGNRYGKISMENEFKEFGKIMAGMALNFSAPPPAKPLLGFWFDAFESDGYSMDQIRQAARLILRGRVYTKMPTYADFVKEIEEDNEDLKKCQAILAWENLTRRLREYGADACRKKKIAFADPKINFAVRMLGGWGVLKNWKVSELPFRERDFKERYLAAMANPSIMIEHKPVDDPRVKGLVGGMICSIGVAAPSGAAVGGVACSTIAEISQGIGTLNRSKKKVMPS